MARHKDHRTDSRRGAPAAPAPEGWADRRSLLGISGGILLIVGTFQPIWTSYSFDLTMLQTAGLYGLVVMAVALTAVTVAFMKAHWLQWGTAAVSALMTILTALKEPKAMVTMTTQGTPGSGQPWSPAWGWILLAAGSLLLLAAAWPRKDSNTMR